MKNIIFCLLILLIANFVPSTFISAQQVNLEMDKSSVFNNSIQTVQQNYSLTNIQKPNILMNTIQPSSVMTISPVVPNDGGASQAGRAPQGGRRFIKTHYLVTPAEMAAFGSGGDLIKTIVWEYLTNYKFAGQNIPTIADSLIIYMQNTTDVTNLKSTTWATAIVGMTTVYRGKMVIPSGEYRQYVFINLGGPGTSPFTTVAGQGLYIAFEHYINSPGLIASSEIAPVVTCNTQGLAGGAKTYQSQTTPTGILTASNARAVTYLGKDPNILVYQDIANVSAIFDLKQAMVYPPDTNKLTIVIDHLRRGILDTLKVKTRIINVIGGGIKHEWNDVIITDSLKNYYITHKYLKEEIIGFSKTDSIVVLIDPVAGENVLFNNTAFTFKYSTLNTSSYYDNNLFASGGVSPGFAGGEFAIRFHCSSPVLLTKFDYGFFRGLGTDATRYKVRVYGAGANQPGAILFTSADLITPVGTLTEDSATYFFPSPVSVPAGDYYVSLSQETGIPPYFAFISEGPIRPNVFYSWNGTTWIEFGTVPSSIYNIKGIIHTATTLQLGMYLQGNFDGNTMVPDTVTVLLRSNSPPYEPRDLARAVVGSDGTGVFSLDVDHTSCYYIILKQRNHLETWSSTCYQFGGSGEYDFRGSASQAFGNNMIFTPAPGDGSGGWGTFGGDVSQEGTINLTDIISIFNDARSFVTGYVTTDINGDLQVNLTDLLITYNNARNFVAVIRP